MVKKIYKLLKRKGGCKEIANGKNVPTTSSISNEDGANDIVELDSSEEEDVAAIECEKIAQKVSNAPRVDKLGFIKKEDTEGPAVPLTGKKHKKDAAKDQKRTLKWLSWISDWNSAFDKQHSKILKYCDYGIPDSVRGEAWKLLSGVAVEGRDNEIYHRLLKSDNWQLETKIQIEKDIHRTMPNHILFHEDSQGRQMLTNVLLAYSIYNPEIGYCQGMGFITAMFLMYMPEEVGFRIFYNSIVFLTGN